jgi:K+-sensing histidine kinase KdpD
LGLSIASEIVQAHGGSLTVRSQPGQGSVFVVKIPLASPDDTTIMTRVQAEELCGCGKKNIPIFR